MAVILKEPLVVPSQVVEVSKQQGKRIVKMFLSDSSININGGRIAKDAQDAIMKTVIGKPYIIPPFLDHPQRPKPYPPRQEDDIALIHKTAKPYESGIVYDLERVSSEDNPGYNAFVELTSDLAIRLFDEGILPRFVSHSIYKLNPNEPDSEMRSAVVNNICAVRNPAYGPKARIMGMCVGDREECKNSLQDAEKHSSIDVDFIPINNNTKEQNNPEGKCETMKAVEQLSENELFRFNNDILKQPEVTSSINMSATTGTVQSETTIEYPASGRVVKKDSQGRVISDTKKGEEMITTTTTTAESKDKDEGNKETITKEEKTEKKEEVTKENKAADITNKKASEQQEDNNNNDKNRPNNEEETEEAKAKASTDRIGALESEIKQFANRLNKQESSTKYYRKKMIETRVNTASYLKPEQKNEHIERWEKTDLHGDDLDFALETAYGPQSAMARVAEGKDREKRSSVALHEDDIQQTDSEKTSSGRKKEDGKLTLDLLTRQP